MTTKGIRRP